MSDRLFALENTPEEIVEGGIRYRRVQCKKCKGTGRITRLEWCIACRDGKVWEKVGRA